jgi:hypothetical protein
MLKYWIQEKIKERSSTDGVIMIAAGAAMIVFAPLTEIIAYAAIAYGAYTIYRKG